MTRTRRFLGGLAFGYFNQALVTLVGLWLTAFLIERLGQADYGLWLVATRILGYLLLLDVGVVGLLPRETAFAVGRAGGVDAARDLPEIVGRTLRLVLWQLPLVALASALVWLALPAEWEPLRQPLGIVMAVFVVTFPTRVLQAALHGLQDLAYLGAVTTITWLASTLASVALVLAGFGLYALAVGWGVAQLGSAIGWWIRLRRRYPRVVPARPPSLAGTQLRERLMRGGWISVAQVAQVLLGGTDLLIIGKLLGAAAVVPYFCTAKVLTVLGNQPLMMAETAQPALSELRSGSSRDRLAAVCTALTRAILIMSGGVVVIVLAVNEGFVIWWVGEDLFGGFALTAVLAAAMLVRHWNVTAIYSLFSFGHDRRISLTTLADGIVTVAASVALVARFGLIGAAIGSLVGAIAIGLPANLAGLARDMGVPARRLVAGLWPWCWRFALVAAPATWLSQVWVPRTLPALVLTTLGAGGIYAAVMLPLALHEPLGTYVRPRLEAVRRGLGRIVGEAGGAGGEGGAAEVAGGTEAAEAAGAAEPAGTAERQHEP